MYKLNRREFLRGLTALGIMGIGTKFAMPTATIETENVRTSRLTTKSANESELLDWLMNQWSPRAKRHLDALQSDMSQFQISQSQCWMVGMVNRELYDARAYMGDERLHRMIAVYSLVTATLRDIYIHRGCFPARRKRVVRAIRRRRTTHNPQEWEHNETDK
jgi:hypothetical protein